MRVAEFFAGIGLVRMALERHGCDVVWANDIEPAKFELYARNFDAHHFVLDDIRHVRGSSVPDVDLATASFPCTDLSLAGARRGLSGEQSGLFWEFHRVIDEMQERRPFAILIENVPSLASSHGGQDLRLIIAALNELGYWCDLVVLDARHFVPQSRPRLFIIASRDPIGVVSDWGPSVLRPAWMSRFVQGNPDLRLQALPLTLPIPDTRTLSDVVERLHDSDKRWWDSDRVARFVSELSPRQLARLDDLRSGTLRSWATAYRRTRHGRPAWEIRPDAISGCLRTARGGSSKQALVEAGGGEPRVRWMTGIEYARLQGAPDYNLTDVPEGNVLFGFGDAVCVPVVEWLVSEYLIPLVSTELTDLRWESSDALASV